MKYITVTLNPAIDQTYTLDAPLKTGELNRASKMCSVSYSGKGINVSKELFRLGVDSQVLCLLQNDGGENAYSALLAEDLNLFAIKVPGRMRRNISIIDSEGAGIEVNEPGEKVAMDDILKFFSMYDRLISAKEKKTVIISGSTPPGFRNDIYKRLIISAKSADSYVVLDADGELLRRGIEGRPDLIKPNEEELMSLTGYRLEGDDNQVKLSALAASSVIFDKTGIEVLCTLGARGSVFVGKEGQFICPAPAAKVKRTKGAGDVFLARYIFEKFEKGSSIFDAMKAASENTSRFLEM